MTAECVERQAVCLAAGEEKPWGFNFALRMARRWTKNTAYPAGATGKTRPSSADFQTGLQYASSGGISMGLVEPRWPKSLVAGKNTVQEGGILWTAELMTEDSLLEQIDTVDWEIPTGITFTQSTTVKTPSEQSSGGQFVGVYRADPYVVRCKVTTTLGNKYFAELEIEVHA